MNDERHRKIIATSILGIIANLLLVIFKTIVGLLSNSIAIILDAINNFSDILPTYVLTASILWGMVDPSILAHQSLLSLLCILVLPPLKSLSLR